MTQNPDEWLELSQASNEAWEKQADIWDDRMGADGNAFHQQLVRPSVTRLLRVQPGQTILDVGCGNGVFARHLANLGVKVTAIDVSTAMIEKARERSRGLDQQITYRVVDATSEGQLATLAEDAFDAIVCNMTLMDLAAIHPLIKNIPRLLKNTGKFVFSIMHPCFNNGVGTSRLVEEMYDQEGAKKIHSIKVTAYISPQSGVSTGICGRDPQFYFHRPLSSLLTSFFEAGLVMDGIEEPVFELKEKRELGQAQFTEIPWAFIGRMRPG